MDDEWPSNTDAAAFFAALEKMSDAEKRGYMRAMDAVRREERDGFRVEVESLLVSLGKALAYGR